MSSIPHNTKNLNEIFDSATDFFGEFRVRKLLFQCNAGKLKGVPVMDIFRYLFCLIFSDRSMYMQRNGPMVIPSFRLTIAFFPPRMIKTCFVKLPSMMDVPLPGNVGNSHAVKRRK